MFFVIQIFQGEEWNVWGREEICKTHSYLQGHSNRWQTRCGWRAKVFHPLDYTV